MLLVADAPKIRQADAKVRGATIVGDFLRPDGKGRPGGVDRPVAWLFNAVKRQIALASGLPTHILTPTASPGLCAWVNSLRDPAHADEIWAAAYADLSPESAWTDAIERLVVSKLRDQFCIGYEMPPYLVRMLDRHAIPHIDIRIHPIRFMDDLLFAVRASHPETQGALSALAIPEGQVIVTAGLREAMCQLLSESAVPPNTLVVLGQRPFDSSQIVDGRFFDAMDHRTEVAAICARHRAVLLKPHPHDRAHSLMTVAAGVAPNVLGAVNDNLYRLLAMPEIAAILTVSSSAAVEARYFGKTVYALAPPPLRVGWRGDATDPQTHASLDDVVLSVDFWRHALAPHARVTPLDGVRLLPKPNRLRIALDSFWNFNEIDTDRIPARANT
jgi:hypothetical protein